MAKCKITVWYFILFTCVYALQNDTVWTKYRCSTSKLRFLTIQSIVLNLKSQDKFLQDDGHFQPIYIANHHSSFLIGLFKLPNYYRCRLWWCSRKLKSLHFTKHAYETFRITTDTRFLITCSANKSWKENCFLLKMEFYGV